MALSQAPLVMTRLHELRTMFGAGQRATSLVEDLFDFLTDVVPLIEEIDGSLRESTGHMPQATAQLQNVTQATEVATTEILDLVDAVLRRLTAPAAPDLPAPGATSDRLRALLRERLAATDPALLAEAEALLDEAAERRAARLATEAGRLQGARDDLNLILVSLQVQDITAQQLASVNHLIESIRRRLNELVSRIADDAPAPAAGPALDPDTFNEHARYERSGSRQADADAVAASASQSDIDALFGTAAPAVADQNDIDALFAAPAAPAASQSDIDALFGA